MNEDQAEELIQLNREILEQLTELKQGFLDFSGYNVYNMQTTIQDITGPTQYNLEDIHKILGVIADTLSNIDINTVS